MPSDDGPSPVVWPDGRYAIFVLVVSLVVAGILALLLLLNDSPNLLFIPGIIFVALLAVLQPRTRPNAKERILRIFLGEQSPISLSHNYRVISERHVIRITEQDGTATIFRRRRLRGLSSDCVISSATHDFKFGNDDATISDGFSINGTPTPVECIDNNGIDLEPEPIIREKSSYEFILPFSSPVGAGEEYEYNIRLEEVSEAFPLSDLEDSWTAKYYVPIEELEIRISFECDIGEIEVYGNELYDTITEDTIAVPETDDETNDITVVANNLEPGNYKLKWQKQHRSSETCPNCGHSFGYNVATGIGPSEFMSEGECPDCGHHIRTPPGP